ncbi:MAG TPA: wax ester/triacylglycerol synthase domain-containing protein, partial [Actinomycetota bacterium]|nr:wax ester/triacylglycerol synthase domain-containing protein [Actinomycetota bacterium]
MAGPRGLERLTAQDLLMLWADDFGWSEDIDEAQLLRACAELYRRRLDPARPLWEALLLPGLPGRQVGLFLRAHHTLADGVAGMAAFGALLDLGADPPVPVAPAWAPAPPPSTGDLLRDNLRRRLRGLGRGLSALARGGGPRRASLGVWREFLAQRAPRTSLNRPIGADRRLAGRGEDVRELALRVMVPVSLHREQAGRASGNRD